MKWLALLLAPLLLCGDHAARAEPAKAKVTFPIGGFSPNPEVDLRNGFTLAGPAYSKRKEKFEECLAVGMPYIYPIGVKVDFTPKDGSNGPETLDFGAIRKEVAAQVREVADSDGIYAWYLVPEELRYWNALEMEYLKTVSETIRESDPRKRPVWMYEPNHRSRGALGKTLPFQQIAGKGLYANYSNRKDERAWVSWSLEQQRLAMADVNPDAVPFAVLEMFREPEEGDQPLIRPWVRHDSYASLLGGAKAIVIYSFAKRKGFESRDRFYNAFAEVASELNGEAALGEVFLRGKETQAPAWRIVSGPETTRISGGRKKIFPDPVDVPSLLVKAYESGGERFLFLVNSTREPMRVSLEGGSDWKPGTPAQTNLFSSGNQLELGPWEVAIFKRSEP